MIKAARSLGDVAGARVMPLRFEFGTKGYVIMSILRGLGVMCGIIFGLGLSSSQAADEDQRAAKTKINWMSFEKAEDLSRAQPRKIFVDVYTSWCSWCKVMDKETFRDPLIVDYVNKK